MNSALTIGDLIEVPEVQTVIRLDQGKTAPHEITRSFVFTRETSDHFTVITDALTKNKGLGYFLQGDFGSGKSHFLACLYALLDNSHLAKDLDHGGIKRFAESDKKFLPVDISLINYRSQSSLEQIIVESMEKALISRGHEAELSPLSSFVTWFTKLLTDTSLSRAFSKTQNIKQNEQLAWIQSHPKEAYRQGIPFLQSQGIELPDLLVHNRDETFERAFSQIQKAGYDGLFLIIDELSEFFRSKPDSHSLNEDARTLQYLGEKTQQQSFWIIGAVQESIEKTGDIAQSTFRKIKDRFPVKLVLSTLHIRSLISERLVKHKDKARETLAALHDEFKNQFSTFKLAFNDFRTIYPVHPATISLLDGLGDLFSVHRGIVDFVHAQIAGDPRRDIPGILHRPAMELLAPDSIYDHFKLRISEFSAFHVYARHILPHLEEVINEVIDDEKSREFARRLMKILILYKIHPTAEPPKAGELAELISCAIIFQNEDLNIRYLTEGLLDPVAEHSRFLVKKSSSDTPAQDRIYEIATEDQPVKLLENRLAPILEELSDTDSRLLMIPLLELEESPAWPGKALVEEGIEQNIDWFNSSRKAFIFFSLAADKTAIDEFYFRFEESGADFALLISANPHIPEMEHTAIWLLPKAPEQLALLREYAAQKILQQSLLPGNPSDSRVSDELNQRIEKSKAMAQIALLEYLYAGSFSPQTITTNSVLKQLKRFDRIIEAAGGALLEKRYPAYKNIAPRRMPPSPRLYQQLLDDFVQPGSISFNHARPRGLHNIIEGLASPLGLVEARSGAYVFSPEITSHGLLQDFFEAIPAASKISLEQLKINLMKGPFGLTEMMFHFLVTSLALSGLISLIRGNKTIPANMINLLSSQKAEEIAPGELISTMDQETLTEECGRLFPILSKDTFGLSVQRELWKAIIKFKDSLTKLTADLGEIFRKNTGFSAFDRFKLESYEKQGQALQLLADSIKVSYSAKEGIQRFITTWRGSNLTEDRILFLRKLSQFLKEKGQNLIFIHHYLYHSETQKAARLDEKCDQARNRVIAFFDNPGKTIVEDKGEALEQAFFHFINSYGSVYRKKHESYYRSFELKKPGKQLKRAIEFARKLSQITALERPIELDELLDVTAKGSVKSCSRRLSEELQASPICGCGFSMDDQGESKVLLPEEMVENIFSFYLKALSRPPILEAIYSWAFAMQDKNKIAAQELTKLCDALKEKKLSKTGLLNFLNEEMMACLSQALAGQVKVEKRSLTQLIKALAGRRLSAEDIKAQVSQWLGQADDATIFSIWENENRLSDDRKEPFLWWPYYHKALFGLRNKGRSIEEPENIEAALESAYPSIELKAPLAKLDSEALLVFAEQERFHYYVIIKAWQILADRLLNKNLNIEEKNFHSCYYLTDTAEELNQAFELLFTFTRRVKTEFPRQLSLRLSLADVLRSPYITDDLSRAAFDYLLNWKKGCDDWASTLPQVQAIDQKSNPVVVICDAVPADIWIEAAPNFTINWYRLVSASNTIDSLKALFDLKIDPMEAFHSQAIDYYSVKGNEDGDLADHLRPLGDKTTVLRLSLFDQAAHSHSLSLGNMAAIFKVLAQRQFPKLKELCEKEKRPLIITTDHGLSLTRQGLTHGAGGVFEIIIPRIDVPVNE